MSIEIEKAVAEFHKGDGKYSLCLDPVDKSEIFITSMRSIQEGASNVYSGVIEAYVRGGAPVLSSRILIRRMLESFSPEIGIFEIRKVIDSAKVENEEAYIHLLGDLVMYANDVAAHNALKIESECNSSSDIRLRAKRVLSNCENSASSN